MKALLTSVGGWQALLDAPFWVLLLLKATAILLAAWLAHLALVRANPRWRVLLWRVAAVSLVGLPAVAWLLPKLEIRVQQPPVEASQPTFIRSDLVVTNPGDAAVGPRAWRDDFPNTHAAGPFVSRGDDRLAAVGPSAPPQTIIPAVARRSPVSLSAWLLSLWLAGIALLMARLGIGYCRIWRTVRRAGPAPQAICQQCERVAQSIGCRRSVELLRSADVASPFLCGLRRPLLLLPARMCEPAYDDDLPGILAHELAHLRSRDLAWNLGLQLIATMLWFHPLAWRVRWAHLASCELICDAASASFVGDAAEYGRILARVAVDVHAPLPAAGIAMARTSSIGRRLRALRTRVFHLPFRRRSVTGFSLIAAAVVVALGIVQFTMAGPTDGD